MKHYLYGILAILAIALPFLGGFYPSAPAVGGNRADSKIAPYVIDKLIQQGLPFEFIDSDGELRKASYSLVPEHQAYIQKLFQSYKPDYGAFVAMEADTGKLLAMNSYTRNGSIGNLAVRASFPAASVFKIITAAAAIDLKKMTGESVIPFKGNPHTLYRRNLAQLDEGGRWIRRMSLREAFAKSVNPIFGKIGMYLLSPEDLKSYALRFGFNQPLFSENRDYFSLFELPSEEKWTLAEAASGFSQYAKISPIHGAMLAATIANDGIMMKPRLLDKVTTKDGLTLIYENQPRIESVAIDPTTALQIQEMMRETVKKGTARRSFGRLLRKNGFQKMEVGGKTGHLDGDEPKGRYDWFVGYGNLNGKKIAVSALTINENFWRVKSAFVAASFLEKFYSK